MSSSDFPPVYVAYRRLDFELVDALVSALDEHLGPAPNGSKSWFFLDRSSIECGSAWYYQINEAHRNASSVLGVLSSKTLPKASDQYDTHAIYMDEIFLGQASGRLLPVRIDGLTDPLHVLGLNQSQCIPWTGTEHETVHLLAGRIRARCTTRTNAKTDPLRQLWIERCRDAGHLDALVNINSDKEVIVRPVPSVVGNKIIGITKHPVGKTASLEHLSNVLQNARAMGFHFRLPYPNEVSTFLDAEASADKDWQHPLDLAVEQGAGSVWARDFDRPDQPVAISRASSSYEQADAASEIWLVLDDWA
ncbi:MAG: toll/interleukin-1 receptor domain-containing protein [Paracoccaceae bacterium]|nr:toll/interleukin-1 receptor domain-containing protein [Paracoccaceae bacterium]